MGIDSAIFVKLLPAFKGGNFMVVAFLFGLIPTCISPSAAADRLKLIKEFGKWTLYCANDVKASDDCAVVQATRDKEKNRFLRAALSFQDDGNVTMLLKTGPIFGDPKRVSLLIDGKQVGFVDASCDQVFCATSLTLLRPYVQSVISAKELGFEMLINKEHGALTTLDGKSLDSAFVEMHTIVTRHAKLGPNDYWAPARLANAAPSVKLDIVARNVDDMRSGQIALGDDARSIETFQMAYASQISKRCENAVSSAKLPIVTKDKFLQGASEIKTIIDTCDKKFKVNVTATIDQKPSVVQTLLGLGIPYGDIAYDTPRKITLDAPEISR